MIAGQVDDITSRFYVRLFSIDESAARLFATVDLPAQRRKLGRTLDTVVLTLDDMDSLLPELAALGKRHAHYGVEPHHIESVGEALIAAMADTLGVRFTPELRAAWLEAYALIASVMRRALIRDAAPPGHAAR